MAANVTEIVGADQIGFFMRNYPWATAGTDMPVLSIGVATDLAKPIWRGASGTPKKVMIDGTTTANMTAGRIPYVNASAELVDCPNITYDTATGDVGLLGNAGAIAALTVDGTTGAVEVNSAQADVDFIVNASGVEALAVDGATGGITFGMGTQNYLLSDRSTGLALQGQTDANSTLGIYNTPGDNTRTTQIGIYALGTPASVADQSQLAIQMTPTGAVIKTFWDSSDATTYETALVLATTGSGGSLNANQIHLATDGNVGILRVPTTYALEVEGVVYCSGDAYVGGDLLDFNSGNFQLSVTGGGTPVVNLISAVSAMNIYGSDIVIASDSNDVGVGAAPSGDAKVEIVDTGLQLRIGADAANRVDFQTSSGGDLTITPSGGDMTVTGNLNVTGMLTGGHYASIYAYGASTSFTLTTQNTWYQITSFSANGVANGDAGDHTNDHITISGTGARRISFTACYSGTLSETFEFQVQKNNGGTPLTDISTIRKLGTGGDVGATAASGIVTATDADTMELWARCTTGAGKQVTPVNLNLSVSSV